MWLFLKILDRSHGYLWYKIFIRNRIKKIIQSCFDQCLIDRFDKGLFRPHVQICDIISPIFLERAIFDDSHTRILILHHQLRIQNQYQICLIINGFAFIITKNNVIIIHCDDKYKTIYFVNVLVEATSKRFHFLFYLRLKIPLCL